MSNSTEYLKLNWTNFDRVKIFLFFDTNCLSNVNIFNYFRKYLGKWKLTALECSNTSIWNYRWPVTEPCSRCVWKMNVFPIIMGFHFKVLRWAKIIESIFRVNDDSLDDLIKTCDLFCMRSTILSVFNPLF